MENEVPVIINVELIQEIIVTVFHRKCQPALLQQREGIVEKQGGDHEFFRLRLLILNTTMRFLSSLASTV